MPAHIDRALAFTDFAASTAEIDAVLDEFRSLIRDFGFDVSVAGTWTGIGKAPRYRFFYNDWPKPWLDYYAAHDYFHRDFIVAESRRRMRPFLWSEIDQRLFQSPAAAEFFAASRDYGWHDGFAVPINGPGGYCGLVSLAARQVVRLTPQERGMLEVAARLLNERCRIEIGFGNGADSLPDLSDRELECMKWAAVGKTDGEIGDLLGLSAATAHFHIEQAKRKVGVSSRVHAVALLVLHGII